MAILLTECYIKLGSLFACEKKNMVIFLGLFVVQGEDVVLPAPLPPPKKKQI